MTVKSKDIPAQDVAPEQEPRRKRYAPPHETGMVEVEQIAGGAVWIMRLLGAALWLGSLFGTYVPLAGGWDAAWWPVVWAALGVAIAIQVPLSYAQWTFKARAVLWWRARDRFGGVAVQTCLGWWLAYWIALGISAAFNIATYTAWLAPLAEPVAGEWGWWIIAALVILGDVLPEWIFVRD